MGIHPLLLTANIFGSRTDNKHNTIPDIDSEISIVESVLDRNRAFYERLLEAPYSPGCSQLVFFSVF